MTSVKKYRLVIEITVEQVVDEQAQALGVQQLKQHISSLDPDTTINDILASGAWNSFYDSLELHTKRVFKGALFTLVRQNYNTIVEVKSLTLPRLWAFRNLGERRINFISEIFDIH